MRDLGVFTIQSTGEIKHGLSGYEITGIYNLIQKVVILLLSESQTTKYIDIVGGDLLNLSRRNFDKIGNNDFKAIIATNVSNIERYIKVNQNNLPEQDQLQFLQLSNVSYDSNASKVSITVVVKTKLGETLQLSIPVVI